MSEFLSSASILLVLLNPFLVIVYLIDFLEELDDSAFRRVFDLRGCGAFTAPSKKRMKLSKPVALGGCWPMRSGIMRSDVAPYGQVRHPPE
jgi:hypothetical protein